MSAQTSLQETSSAKALTEREHAEHSRLLRRWATGFATAKQIERCQSLDRRVEANRLATAYANDLKVRS